MLRSISIRKQTEEDPKKDQGTDELEMLRNQYLKANENDGDQLILRAVKQAMCGVDLNSENLAKNREYRDFVYNCQEKAKRILDIPELRETTIVLAIEGVGEHAIVACSCSRNATKNLNRENRARVYKVLENARDSITSVAFAMSWHDGDLNEFGHHLIPVVKRFAEQGVDDFKQEDMWRMLKEFVMDSYGTVPTKCKVTDEVMFEIVKIFAKNGFWANLTFISNVERFSEVVRQTARMALKNMEIPTIHMKITDCRTGKTTEIPIRKETRPNRLN